jgi:hypothetical protein
MSRRRAALLGALVLVACTRTEKKAAPVATAAEPESEPAAPPERPSAPAPRVRWRDRTDFDCERAKLDGLAAAVAKIVDNPRVKPPGLDETLPLARAFLAYAAAASGRADEARLRFDDAVIEVAGDVSVERRPNEWPPPGWWQDGLARRSDGSMVLRTLRLARIAAEDLDAFCSNKGGAVEAPLPLTFPCKLFDKHPHESIVAFENLHGDIYDVRAFARRDECAAEILSKSAPEAEATAAAASLRTLEKAVLDAGRPRPQEQYEIDEWVSRSYAVREVLQNEVLAPGENRRERPAAAVLAEAVDKATQSTRATTARVAAFKRTLATEAPALATGICAVASARGAAMPAERCAERARDTASYALADWLVWGD